MAEITENEDIENEVLPGDNEGAGLGSDDDSTTDSDVPDVSSVVVEEDDGEIDGYDPEDYTPVVTKQYCQGSFRMMTSPEFTQDKNYSDEYLRSKGLFQSDTEAE